MVAIAEEKLDEIITSILQQKKGKKVMDLIMKPGYPANARKLNDG